MHNGFSFPACSGSAREEKVQPEECEDVVPVSKPMTQQVTMRKAKSVSPVPRRVRATSTSGKSKMLSGNNNPSPLFFEYYVIRSYTLYARLIAALSAFKYRPTQFCW